jgi:hypothetical protein
VNIQAFATHASPTSHSFKGAFVPLGCAALLGTSIALVYFNSITNTNVRSILKYALNPKDDNTDATRMTNRLQRFGLMEKPVAPDGNCQMRALADQLFDNPDQYREVRSKIVDWLRSNEKFPIDDEGSVCLGDFLDLSQFPTWGSYCDYMSQNGAWGDHMTLIAAAEAFKVKIWVLSSVDAPDNDDNPQFITTISPKKDTPTKTVRLAHWHEMHFNSLYPVGQSA